VFLYVYQLRRHGIRQLKKEILSAAPASGRLVMGTAQRGDVRTIIASLYDREAKDVIQQLVHARVLKINVGMHIAGMEFHGRAGSKARVTPHPQSWVCALIEADLETLIKLIPEHDPNDPFDGESPPSFKY
jgi:hypothetical protein